MLNTVFLIPIDHRGIHGKLFQQYLELQSWCEKNNSKIVTCSGLFLNFARNFLATGGRETTTQDRLRQSGYSGLIQIYNFR